MKIGTMFARNINRNINGVIKVGQDDEKSLEQELSEYVITRELRGHFQKFIDHYTESLDEPTDRIGVWISGFFGSGKSHFLKMLSYILSGRQVGEKKAVEYFKDKLDDPMMYAQMERCASVPTESILFNIDIEGPMKKDRTAVLWTFAKVFYNHCGFYGDDSKIVRLEKFVEEQGKTSQFRETFEQINGAAWTEVRDSAAFFEDDVAETMEKVLGMSQQAARNWFNSEETNEMTIKSLVADIKKYVDRKGKDFRLLFMVDEIGQYIGDDGDLMINLQSIVEEIGTRCGGRVWVMVTSQEAIDSIVKITGDDFSKIQGRFNTRLSLSSSSVAEVIQKRVLAKTKEADQLLRLVYADEHAVLKNLFTFNDAVMDIKGFTNEEEYSASYPFIPYQFTLIQKVIAEVRRHGVSGKSVSGGERSMLSGFQEAAQKVQESGEEALVPFYLFYDTISTFLDSSIRRVIERCLRAAENHDGIETQDVNVLKLLYLLRYIDDIKANTDNLAVLMIDDVNVDKIALRTDINGSLDRLISQNYVARSGDTYSFLTDEEQEISRDIKNTVLDMAQITQSIAQTVYGEIYPAKKFKYGKYDIPYDQYVDETLYGSASGGMRLKLLTVAGNSGEIDEPSLIMESQANSEAIVILTDDAPYFDELEQSMKIRRYIKQRNTAHLAESVQNIIRQRQQQARAQEERARDYLEEAIVNAKVIICGETMQIRAGSAKEKIDEILRNLTESVYTKLYMINTFADGDGDILKILNGSGEENLTIAGSGANNEEALADLSQWIELRGLSTVTVSDIQQRYQAIPYGFREIDIAALIARLAAQKKISIKYGGVEIRTDDPHMPEYLRRKGNKKDAVVTKKEAVSDVLLQRSAEFLREYTGEMNIPREEDGMTAYVTEKLQEKREHCLRLQNEYYAKGKYPGADIVGKTAELTGDILERRRDNTALLEYMLSRQDDLLDAEEDMEEVNGFFATQADIYENAFLRTEQLRNEREYLSSNREADEAFKAILSILAMERPYSRIKELPQLLTDVNRTYQEILDRRKQEVLEVNRQCMADIHQTAEITRGAGQAAEQADAYFVRKRDEIGESGSIIEIDAKKAQMMEYRDRVLRDMENLSEVSTGVQEKISRVSRGELCPLRKLQSAEDIDAYVEAIRQKLYAAIEENDAVQIG